MTLDLARLYRQEGDDCLRDWQRREEHLHSDTLPEAARRWYVRALCILVYIHRESLEGTGRE